MDKSLRPNNMSHNPHETIICPNCGYHATYNYCAECGQETHLHKDTFWGLITHFIGHYFHYDSKFWKTMKLLWFHPGALTIAYAKKQRNRFIPPISLYIFISFVFFLLYTTFARVGSTTTTETELREQRADSIALASAVNRVVHRDTVRHYSEVGNSLLDAHVRVGNLDPKKQEEAAEKSKHAVPKLFFFMIPLMAGLLKLLFFKRKDLYFVDHAVFSLHYHSFWFSAMLLALIDPFESISWLSYSIAAVSILAVTVYFVLALKNVYQTSWLKAILSVLLISVVYLVVLGLIYLLSFLYFAAG